MTDLEVFTRQLRNATDLVDRAARAALETTAAIAEKELRATTPRATGKAQEAWRTEKTSPTRAEIVNDTVYIHALEHGSSAQAPYGIVEPALSRAEKKADKALRRLLDPLG